MDFITSAAALFAERGWFIAGIVFTVFYFVVLYLMLSKARRERGLTEDQKPAPRPLFYFGQAYLAFVWPVPLFLVLELLDTFTVSP